MLGVTEGVAMSKAYLETGEVRDLEKVATNLRDRLLIRLLFHLGCRITEALRITVSDINFDQRTVTIEHLKARIISTCPDCGTRLSKTAKFCPGCGEKVDTVATREKEHRRVRTLPVDGETLAMLKDYVRRGGPVNREGRMLIFGINRHRAWQIVKECADRAKLPKLVNPETGKVHNVSPHRLRDAFSVHAIKLDDSGDGLRLLQEHLGHGSFNTTAKYRKVAGEELKSWYDKLWKKEVKPDGP